MVAMDGPLDPAAARQVRGMTGTLAHRGPDGDGYHVDLFAALGHRRLAIIDRAGGDQPMANEDGSCWIVFNGEVYNHRELRRELEGRGHAFRTHCDTEAIIHAYEEWGTDCVARLEGMFAFAIYDKRDRTVLLARDRLGKKPLFFFVRGGVLHFASELKALRASPLWEGDLNTDAFEEYLQLGYILAPETAYRNVFKLEPGHWLRTKNGRLEQRAYWDITEPTGALKPSFSMNSTRSSAAPFASGWRARFRSARSSRAASIRDSSCRTCASSATTSTRRR
jgi:asparagine synthase (glutamine-hydrolysing)